VFKDAGFASSHPTILLSTAPSSFDLFRALYPTSRAGRQYQDGLLANLQYSNDCKFLAETARKLQAQYDKGVLVKSQEFESVAARFEEVADKLDVMGSSQFDESIVSRLNIILPLLLTSYLFQEEEIVTLLKLYSGSGNLRNLGYDVQFNEAQNSIKAIKDHIVILSKDLKVSLNYTIPNRAKLP
jgi:hypothetical protein